MYAFPIHVLFQLYIFITSISIYCKSRNIHVELFHKVIYVNYSLEGKQKILKYFIVNMIIWQET